VVGRKIIAMIIVRGQIFLSRSSSPPDCYRRTTVRLSRCTEYDIPHIIARDSGVLVTAKDMQQRIHPQSRTGRSLPVAVFP
jgi:hypothetical protein